jgi:hypothetical protein
MLMAAVSVTQEHIISMVPAKLVQLIHNIMELDALALQEHSISTDIVLGVQ